MGILFRDIFLNVHNASCLEYILQIPTFSEIQWCMSGNTTCWELYFRYIFILAGGQFWIGYYSPRGVRLRYKMHMYIFLFSIAIKLQRLQILLTRTSVTVFTTRQGLVHVAYGRQIPCALAPKTHLRNGQCATRRNISIYLYGPLFGEGPLDQVSDKSLKVYL